MFFVYVSVVLCLYTFKCSILFLNFCVRCAMTKVGEKKYNEVLLSIHNSQLIVIINFRIFSGVHLAFFRAQYLHFKDCKAVKRISNRGKRTVPVQFTHNNERVNKEHLFKDKEI